MQKQKAAGAVSLSLEPAHADSPRGGHSDGGADSDGFEPEDARAFSSTDTYPPRGREARARRAGDAFGGISARKTRGDYKDVLHAFQMDQDVPGGASPRGDDSEPGAGFTPLSSGGNPPSSVGPPPVEHPYGPPLRHAKPKQLEALREAGLNALPSLMPDRGELRDSGVLWG